MFGPSSPKEQYSTSVHWMRSDSGLHQFVLSDALIGYEASSTF